jgi:hypothetical protein
LERMEVWRAAAPWRRVQVEGLVETRDAGRPAVVGPAWRPRDLRWAAVLPRHPAWCRDACHRQTRGQGVVVWARADEEVRHGRRKRRSPSVASDRGSPGSGVLVDREWCGRRVAVLGGVRGWMTWRVGKCEPRRRVGAERPERPRRRAASTRQASHRKILGRMSVARAATRYLASVFQLPRGLQTISSRRRSELATRTTMRPMRRACCLQHFT